MTAFSVTVYYEDTDALGIVYHANYLKYLERARTHYLKSLGFDLHTLYTNDGMGYVVRKMDIQFLKPAHLNDQLIVKTDIAIRKPTRSEWQQTIWRDDALITQANSEIICIGAKGKPQALPQQLSDALS